MTARILAVSVVLGAVAALLCRLLSDADTTSRAWVDQLPETDDVKDADGVREAFRESLDQMLIAWYGLGTLCRAGCHAWGRLLVNAHRRRTGRQPLTDGQDLRIAVTYSRLYDDAPSDGVGRLLSTVAAAMFFLALPTDPLSKPMLAAIYGSQVLFLLGDGYASAFVYNRPMRSASTDAR